MVRVKQSKRNNQTQLSIREKKMLIPILDVCRKRKRTPKCFDFHSFGDPGSPIAFTAPFRDNIRIFVNECAELEDYEIEGMPIWCTLLTTTSNVVLPLYTVEESVHSSQNPFCDQCRCTGWGNNLVSKRKYHIIIPVRSSWNRQLEEGALDLESHLLHGLIHCNGFGHLLCINGIEGGGGSKLLSGREIMDLWDRICGSLRARSVSVEDVSKKRSMDLRLLYGVAYGHSWFGRWGYRFSRGSFGVTEQSYNRALEALASLPLDPILADFDSKGQGEELRRMVRHYRDLCRTRLTNLGELLRFMLDLKSCRCGSKKEAIPNGVNSTPSSRVLVRNPSPLTRKAQNRCRKFSSVIATLDSRWSAKRMEFAAGVIVEALKVGKSLNGEGMSRQQVRDAARMHVGDTGLLDYVLKSMNNVAIGNSVIRRAVNPRTRTLEYSIADLGQEGSSSAAERKFQEQSGLLVPGIDLYGDISYLYKNVLLNYPDSELVDTATLTVLDSKHFVKDWPLNDRCDQLLRLLCRVDAIDAGEQRKPDISEIVVLPPDATMVELKQAVEEALRDSYAMLENVEVIEVKYMEDVDDDQALAGEMESGSEIVVRVAVAGGREMKVISRCSSSSSGDGEYEGGAENWRVKCECGARDDDGERMVACDVCEVWQHTRCVGIDDSEKAPPLFVCSGCCVALGGEDGGGRMEMIDFGTSVDDMLMMGGGGGFECGGYLLC